MTTLSERIARTICIVQNPQIDPDTVVELGAPLNGPKGSRVVMQSMRYPAWHLFTHDGYAAISGMRAWIEAHPTEDCDQMSAAALVCGWIDEELKRSCFT